jgi:hypothetical protein
LHPFTRESAIQKVRLAEDGWNSRDPAKMALAYAIDSRWRNRSEFISGRSEIIAFLSRKWAKELDYKLIKESSELCRSAWTGTSAARRLITPPRSSPHEDAIAVARTIAADRNIHALLLAQGQKCSIAEFFHTLEQ